jgi:hypothetical protein
MKNLTDELLNSFKQRIIENEELVNDVQGTLDGFRKDQQEMAAVLNANAAALRKGLARGEKERMSTFTNLMAGINGSINSIQQEVAAIQSSTISMIGDFSAGRIEMAAGLEKTFSNDRAERMQNEKIRMKEFDALMKNINADIRSINDEVRAIFTQTNSMLERFGKEHADMSEELREQLGKNLAERVAYTKNMLEGFQKRLSEIGRENLKMAQKLKKDLATGETERMNDYNDILKGIHADIKGIRKAVRDIQKATGGMLDDLLDNRVDAAAEWKKMQAAMSRIRKSNGVAQPKQAARKVEKKEVKPSPVMEAEKEVPVKTAPVAVKVQEEPKTLQEKVLAYIDKHPKGVKISEMEEPLGETRMKLGYTAKGLLDDGKVQKIDNIYYPRK